MDLGLADETKTWHRGHELSATAPPNHIIDRFLPEQSLALLFSPPGLGKSFLALDLVASLATGTPWLGLHPVRKGPVIYIAAEGASGFGLRVAAWRAYHKIPEECLRDLVVVSEPINLRDTKMVDGFTTTARRVHKRTAVVVVDTLARCMDGAENVGKHMSDVVVSCARIQTMLGATVLLVHHTPKHGKGPRGHGSLLAAADVAYGLTRHEVNPDSVVLTCEKAKDIAEPEPLVLDKLPVDLPACEATSLILRLSAEQARSVINNYTVMLDVLGSLAVTYPDGVPTAKWAELAHDKGIGRTLFYELKRSLEAAGKILSLGKKGQPDRRYKLPPSPSEPVAADVPIRESTSTATVAAPAQ